ncbi:DAK2 domain-containing protein [Paraburkholderia xenovorans]|uniref:DAK2 domain-containing protein n=1 Tax=Paraburkholderia xenovorans TaxID=36873 RepID=UPI0005A20ADC
MRGSSGPVYATALVRASRSFSDSSAPTAQQWVAAFRSAADAISELRGAKPADRTMLDALVPAIEAFDSGL